MIKQPNLCEALDTHGAYCQVDLSEIYAANSSLVRHNQSMNGKSSN